MTSFHRKVRQVYTPLLTPFSGDAIDFQALEAAVDRQIVAGVDGIVVGDVIGEGHALSRSEWDAVLWTCVSRGGQHLSVIAATGTNCTRTTIERSLYAEELGVDALLLTVPYYSKPTLSGVIDHFVQIAAAVTKPILIDDEPSRTAKDYGIQLFEQLASVELVAGFCHGSERLAHFARLPKGLRERFAHFSRDDATMFDFLDLGGHGIVSPIANIIPSPVQMLVSTAEQHAGLTPLAQSVMDAVAAMGRDDISDLKEAASLVHRLRADVRLPLVRSEQEAVTRIRHAFSPFARCDTPSRAAAA